MNEQQLKNKIKNIVNENINDFLIEKKRNYIRNIIKEEVQQFLIDKAINEEQDKSKRLGMRRSAVMSMLKNDIYDHAPLAYSLYDANDESEKATARSLFSKKANGTPDTDGQIRHFDNTEINKLYNLLKTKK